MIKRAPLPAGNDQDFKEHNYCFNYYHYYKNDGDDHNHESVNED